MALRPTVMTIFDLEQRSAEWQALVRKLGQRAKVTKAQVAKLHSLLHDVREAGVSEVTPARRYELQELARTMADDIFRMTKDYPSAVIADPKNPQDEPSPPIPPSRLA